MFVVIVINESFLNAVLSLFWKVTSVPIGAQLIYLIDCGRIYNWVVYGGGVVKV